ncbi:MAG: hypothetical protein OEZ34_06505 [Spirochaetia bacterium]|nr:hypothetical protein [Spirochaetia bacterium]
MNLFFQQQWKRQIIFHNWFIKGKLIKPMVLIFLSVFFTSASSIISQNTTAGDYFYKNQKYELATAEYMRLYLKGIQTPAVKQKLALSFMRNGNYRESIPYLDSKSFESRHLKIYASLKSGFHAMAMDSYLTIKNSALYSSDQKFKSKILAGTILIEKGEYQKARNFYESISTSSENLEIKSTSEHVILYLDQIKEKRKKSRVLAGIMSGILPGSGQMYAGHFTDGLISFFINGFLIGSAAYANHAETRAGMSHGGSVILGAVALIFYSANIAGAVASAKRYNIYQERKFHRDLRERFFNLDRMERDTNISFTVKY